MNIQGKVITLEWLRAASIRAVKTAAQTALSMFVVGQVLSDVNWLAVSSCAAVAAIFSLLTSLAGLPEVGTDGTLMVDLSSKEDGELKFNLDITQDKLLELKDKDKIKLEVSETSFDQQ